MFNSQSTFAVVCLLLALAGSVQGQTSAIQKGMTWQWVRDIAPSGVVQVGCSMKCDGYKGDTSCSTALPLLCIKKGGLPKPASVNDSDKYYRWAGGIVATTADIVPPSTLAAVNAICAKEFGPDWRVAEHHDGWGWGFLAYGGVGEPNKRFWIHINNQPANCWK